MSIQDLNFSKWFDFIYMCVCVYIYYNFLASSSIKPFEMLWISGYYFGPIFRI